ncbi:hypothetical protein CRYUN_Cryun14cG0050800 [Craigia yunnanensis]
MDFILGKETKARTFPRAHTCEADDVAELALKFPQCSEASGIFKRITIITQGAEPIVVIEDETMK